MWRRAAQPDEAPRRFVLWRREPYISVGDPGEIGENAMGFFFVLVPGVMDAAPMDMSACML